jgi:excisionase family DNA binding protein
MTDERIASTPVARRGRPSESETEGAAFGHARGRRHRDNDIRFFTIAEVAERLHVATRTVRRWIVAGDLVVHRAGAVVRVSEDDLRAFLALHREG